MGGTGGGEGGGLCGVRELTFGLTTYRGLVFSPMGWWDDGIVGRWDGCTVVLVVSRAYVVIGGHIGGCM